MNPETIMYIGDNRKILPKLPPNSVHLIITSPPYWNLKDYKVNGQIGHGQEYQDYIISLKDVFFQCYRVLHPGCKMIINVADVCHRNQNNDFEVVSLHNSIINICENIGMINLGNIIWSKRRAIKKKLWGSYPFPRNPCISYDYEYINIFKKPGKAPMPVGELKERSKIKKEYRSKWFRGIWDVEPVHYQSHKDHAAAFPREIPERLIQMFSFAGETVLDPFAGTGTTIIAAEKFGRNGIGIELNPAFIPQINNFGEVRYE